LTSAIAWLRNSAAAHSAKFTKVGVNQIILLITTHAFGTDDIVVEKKRTGEFFAAKVVSTAIEVYFKFLNLS
jgi:hypothetical protein